MSENHPKDETILAPRMTIVIIVKIAIKVKTQFCITTILFSIGCISSTFIANSPNPPPYVPNSSSNSVGRFFLNSFTANCETRRSSVSYWSTTINPVDTTNPRQIAADRPDEVNVEIITITLASAISL